MNTTISFEVYIDEMWVFGSLSKRTEIKMMEQFCAKWNEDPKKH